MANVTLDAVFLFLTKQYAMGIYLLGNSSVSLSTIPAEYVEPVKQYAALNYSIAAIDNALAQGWITQQEYADTIAYMV